MSLRASAFLLVAALCVPTPAQAHLVSSGLGPFYDGALHLLLTPMDLVGLATLSLFAASQGPEAGRLLVVVAPTMWLLAGLLAMSSGMSGSFGVVQAASLVLVGGSVALGLTPSPFIAAATAVCLVSLLGFQSGMQLRASGSDWVALLGAGTVTFAVTLSVTALVVSCTAFGFRVAFRVLASWAAATGLLSIGWFLQVTN